MAADDEDKWVRLVAKLISDTRGRQIKWKPLPLDSTVGAAIAVASGKNPLTTYFASVGEKGFRMDLVDEREGLVTKRGWRLSIASAEGKPIKRLPISSGLSDLVRAIEDQIAQVDEFLDQYLKS